MDIPVYVVEKKYSHGMLYVRFSNGRVKSYDAIALGCEWLKMSNDAFYRLHGFSFNPHEFGLYEICRRKVYGNN